MQPQNNDINIRVCVCVSFLSYMWMNLKIYKQRVVLKCLLYSHTYLYILKLALRKFMRILFSFCVCLPLYKNLVFHMHACIFIRETRQWVYRHKCIHVIIIVFSLSLVLKLSWFSPNMWKTAETTVEKLCTNSYYLSK